MQEIEYALEITLPTDAHSDRLEPRWRWGTRRNGGRSDVTQQDPALPGNLLEKGAHLCLGERHVRRTDEAGVPCPELAPHGLEAAAVTRRLNQHFALALEQRALRSDTIVQSR